MIKRAVNVIVSLAVIFTAFFPLSVYAQEDETSEVDDNYFIDRESYMAYKLFENLGYQPGATVLKEKQLLKYELVSSGEMNLNGDGTATFNVELVSFTDDENNTIDVTSTTNINEVIGKHYIDGTPTSYINVPKLTFKSTGTNNTYQTVQNKIDCNKVTGTYGWTANTAGTQGTLNLPNYQCTYSPYSKTELDSINLNTNNLTFEVSQHNITGTDTTNSQIVFDLDINTTGTVTGDLTFNLEGTFDYDTTGNVINDIEHSWIYNYPIMILKSAKRAVINSTFSFNSNYNGYPFIISFIATNSFNVNDFNIEPITSGNVTPQIILKRTIKSSNLPGFNKVTIIFVSDTPSSSFYFSPKYPNYSFIPLYYGDGSDLSDEFSNFIGINNRTQNLIENGNTASQNVENNTYTTNTQLIGTSGQYTNIENQFNNNFTNSINNLNISDTLTNNQKFASSANWVRVQFNRIVNNTPFASVMTFCLIIGFALIMIGKVRR